MEKLDKIELGKRIAKQHDCYTYGEQKVKINKEPSRLGRLNIGSFVTIRSVHKERDTDELFIGIYLGTIRTSSLFLNNPVFYVPKLKIILAGFESWWKPIPERDYNLTCQVMKEKSCFTWEDIDKFCEKLLKLNGG